MILTGQTKEMVVRCEGDRVLLIYNGTLVCSLPYQAAEQLSRAILAKAKQAEEQAKPEIRQLRSQLFFDGIALAAPPPEALEGRLAAAATDSEARYQLAAHQVMANDIEGAMENLLAVMQRDRRFGDDAARLALLRLFEMLGDDPAVNRYRARMFNLLH